MIKPNPQIELHRAWYWLCEECGEGNFERGMVRQLISSEDMYGPEPDAETHDIAIAEAVCDMSDEEVEALIGGVDEDDECEDCDCDEHEDDDELIAIESYSVPQVLECSHCGACYSDVVVGGDSD